MDCGLSGRGAQNPPTWPKALRRGLSVCAAAGCPSGVRGREGSSPSDVARGPKVDLAIPVGLRSVKLSPPSRPAGGRALAMSCCYCPAVMSSPLPTSSSWSLALLTVQGFNWIVISTAPLSLDRGPASLPNAGRKHIYVHVTSSPLYKVAWATHAPHLRRGWVRRQGIFLLRCSSPSCGSAVVVIRWAQGDGPGSWVVLGGISDVLSGWRQTAPT